MWKLGNLVTCDRCGKKVFVPKDDHAYDYGMYCVKDGPFDTSKRVDLCQGCQEEYERVIDAFWNPITVWMEEMKEKENER